MLSGVHGSVFYLIWPSWHSSLNYTTFFSQLDTAFKSIKVLSIMRKNYQNYQNITFKAILSKVWKDTKLGISSYFTFHLLFHKYWSESRNQIGVDILKIHFLSCKIRKLLILITVKEHSKIAKLNFFHTKRTFDYCCNKKW